MTDKAYECTCERWKKNIGFLDKVFILAYVHGIQYDGVEFDYCPWCGELLKPPSMDMVAEPVVHN
jgi:hypothetical protein